ncbi:MAG: hypothetical protein JRG73_19345 [Deltaproteobacteria bacterium]|nr:hypothetical protein [Deltaproteobacteria bacterium]
MSKRKFGLSALFIVFYSSAHIAAAAVPFSAPVSFDLEGSSISFAVSLETQRLGTLEMGITPNPAPLNGYIDINQMNQETGVFSGAFREVSASTAADAPRLGLSFPINVTINGSAVPGIFIWNQDKVVFYPEALVAALSFGTRSWNIPFSGIPLVGHYRDGRLTLQSNLEFSDNYNGYDFTVQIGIDLVGRMQTQNTGGLWFNLQTNREMYLAGDNLKLYASLGYFGQNQMLDVYLALIDPSGNALFAPEYTSVLAPVGSVMLETGYYIPPTLIFDVAVPVQSPPIISTGQYQFLAAFCRAGTMDLVGDIASAEFSFNSSITTGQEVVQNQRFEKEPGLIEGAPGHGGPLCESAGVEWV